MAPLAETGFMILMSKNQWESEIDLFKRLRSSIVWPRWLTLSSTELEATDMATANLGEHLGTSVILCTVEHGQARTHASTKLPRQSHFLFDCGVLETPQILGLEHKSKDKLQRV